MLWGIDRYSPLDRKVYMYVAYKIRPADEYIIPPYIPVRTKELQHPKGMLS